MSWEWLEGQNLKTQSSSTAAIGWDRQRQRRTFFNSVIAAFTGWYDSRNDGAKAVHFGGGDPLSQTSIDTFLEATQNLQVNMPWEAGDMLWLDNRLILHARQPYEGDREVFAHLTKDRKPVQYAWNKAGHSLLNKKGSSKWNSVFNFDAEVDSLKGPSKKNKDKSKQEPQEKSQYNDEFEKEMFNGLEPLEGSIEILSACSKHGIKTGVLTNKYGPHARKACSFLGFDKYLEFTIGVSDTEWKKPESLLSQYALKKIGHSSQDTLYIGDSPYDYKTAVNAGMDCLLVSTGTHSHNELTKLASGLKVENNLLSLLPLIGIS